MRPAFLIAWREFAENAKTKGFWLGLLLFPAIITASIQVPILLEKKGTPTRHFVLVDGSGEFVAVLAEAFERAHQRRVLGALRDYAGENLARSGDRPALLSEFADTKDGTVDKFRARGGAAWFLAQLAPGLRTNAPAFKPPELRFRREPLPEGVPAQAPPDIVAQQLRPWLRGEQKLSVDGQDEPLFAAVIIPPDLLAQVKGKGAAADRTRETERGLPGRSGSAAGTAPEIPAASAAAAKLAALPVRGIQYWSENLADNALPELIESTVNAELRRREYVERGLDQATVRDIEQTRAPVTSLNPKKAAGEETVGLADRIRQWLPSAFVYLLWVAIFAIAQMLLTSVIEEKSNRIIEVLLSSVTPGEIMVGKLLGIASIGLTMLAVWIGSFVVIVLWKAAGISPAQAAAAGGMAQVPGDIATLLRTTWLLPAFALYFLLGFLFYSGLILALGSTCNTLKEAQSFMGVIVLFLMVPLMLMTYIPRDPNGPLATALSWFPPYTPFVMMNRVTADPPMRDVVGTLVLMVVATAGVLWGAGKIFRTGILRTGQPPRLLELFRWLKA